MGAARDLSGAARFAAYAAGQAAVVAHVAAHELGAAAYAIKAVRAAAPKGESESAGRRECQWQRAQLPSEIRALVLDDQRLRNEICWFVFECWADIRAKLFAIMFRRTIVSNVVPGIISGGVLAFITAQIIMNVPSKW
jgi:hypothetical protein